MTFDYLLVAGVLVLIVSFTSFLNAFSSSGSPRVAMLLLVTGATMISYVMISRPNTYSIDRIPDAFVRVLASLLG